MALEFVIGGDCFLGGQACTCRSRQRIERNRERMFALPVGIDHHHDRAPRLPNVRCVGAQKHGHGRCGIGERAHLAGDAEPRQLLAQRVRLADLCRHVEVARRTDGREAGVRGLAVVHVFADRELESHRHHEPVTGRGRATQPMPVDPCLIRRVFEPPRQPRAERRFRTGND